MAKIDVDKMSIEVIKNLQLYTEATIEVVEKAVKETAKETVQELRVTSPEGNRGDYTKSWKQKRDSEARGKNKFNMIVYSEKPHYRLTHLLENGHALKRGGRTVGKARAFPHIKNAELNAIERLETKITRGIQEVSK